MSKAVPKVIDVPILDIYSEERVRSVDGLAVEELATDIAQTGLRQPIEVRKVPHRENRIELISGAHRFAACLMLGYETIPAFFVTCSDADADMRELDENLIRKDLTTLDRAMFLARKKALYEDKYPETKRGVAGGIARQNSATENISVAENDINVEPPSFVASSAETLGCTERKIYMLIAAAERLTRAEYAQLSTAPRKPTLDDLLTLAKIAEAAQRAHVIEALAYGDVKNAKEALAQLSDNKPAPVNDARVVLKAVNAGFKKAPKKVQLAFVKANRKRITKLLEELE